MDLSSSSVIKRHLIEPIKLDAQVKRPLLSSGHNIPILECSATLDFVKVMYNIIFIIFLLIVRPRAKMQVHCSAFSYCS